MANTLLANAIKKLAQDFNARDWKYFEVSSSNTKEKIYYWPGTPEEEIMVCVYKGQAIHEFFHRQDFFFFNYAYKGSYGAFSYHSDNYIIVHEGECYIGQPFNGYAIYKQDKEEFIIVGVLVQKDTFFKTFLSFISFNAKLLQFFLIPRTNEFSNDFIHLKFEDNYFIKALLEMMIIEYAHNQKDSQAILKPLALTLFTFIARQYTISTPVTHTLKLSEQIMQYISEHSDKVTLKDIAKQFSYHPNYISTLLHREVGKSFSEILLEQRMKKAVILLKGTNLSIEKIATLIGYTNSSNFYKAFQKYYGKSPREY